MKGNPCKLKLKSAVEDRNTVNSASTGSEKRIVLYDLVGRKVWEKTLSQNDDTNIDFGTLQMGIYIMQELIGNTQVSTKKININ
jgi:hypothetical protein